MSSLSQSQDPQLLMHLKVFRGHIKNTWLIVQGEDCLSTPPCHLSFRSGIRLRMHISIVRHLREHYNEQAAFEGFKVTRLLFNSKMEVGTSPVQYALQMYNRIKRLDQLGHWMDPKLSIDLILARLPDSFAQFMLDYEMVH